MKQYISNPPVKYKNFKPEPAQNIQFCKTESGKNDTGLLNEFDVPFRPVDDGIEWSYNYDILNMFGYIFNNIVDNIAFNLTALQFYHMASGRQQILILI